MQSLLQAVLHATLISQLVLLFLMFMSLASWAFMCGKWFQLKNAQKKVDDGLYAFDDAGELHKSLPIIEHEKNSPLYGITYRAIREFNRLNKTGDAERLLDSNVRRALRFGTEQEMAKLKSSLSLLATTANTAPFIGLFGTVWGILYSFQTIATMKSVSIATVAPGIAEALIATAVGLFVAIPATCGYNVFRSKIIAIEGECIIYAGQLLNRMQHELGQHEQGIKFAGER